MNVITLARLKALDTLSRPQEVAQLVIIINFIKTATLDELDEFEKRLLRYKGRNRNNLIATVKLRKVYFPPKRNLQNNSKSNIIPKKTSTNGTMLSFWRFLPFWNSSQQAQQPPKVENKQSQISEKTQQMQSMAQHEPTKKIQSNHYRSKEPTADLLLSELQQPLLQGPMSSVEDVGIANSRTKQKKSWRDYMCFSSKVKEP